MKNKNKIMIIIVVVLVAILIIAGIYMLVGKQSAAELKAGGGEAPLNKNTIKTSVRVVTPEEYEKMKANGEVE